MLINYDFLAFRKARVGRRGCRFRNPPEIQLWALIIAMERGILKFFFLKKKKKRTNANTIPIQNLKRYLVNSKMNVI